ncbi:MAG: biotin--[acetyl-CoA-carboxylase] ligase [Geminicoccaceae bacterium]
MSEQDVRLPAGYRLQRFDHVGSTSDLARAAAEAGLAGPAVFWAVSQGTGRGRHGHRWVSPRGNLYATLLLRPDVPAKRLAELSLLTAVALAEAIMPWLRGGTTLSLKWPNDVLVNGAKVSGLLLETADTKATRPAVLVGTGVNVASAPQGVPYPVCALNDHATAPVPLERLLSGYLDAFERWCGRWQSQGLAPVRAAWLARAHGLGQHLHARLGERRVSGAFRDLDPSGALLLETAPGRVEAITAGEVFFPDARSELEGGPC